MSLLLWVCWIVLSWVLLSYLVGGLWILACLLVWKFGGEK